MSSLDKNGIKHSSVFVSWKKHEFFILFCLWDRRPRYVTCKIWFSRMSAPPSFPPSGTADGQNLDSFQRFNQLGHAAILYHQHLWTKSMVADFLWQYSIRLQKCDEMFFIFGNFIIHPSYVCACSWCFISHTQEGCPPFISRISSFGDTGGMIFLNTP